MSDKTYSGVRPMAVSSEGIRFVKNIMAPTRDGTKLAMDIHMPAGGGPWPVILTYIPYRKDDQEPLTGMQHHWAQHGYVGARVDCRGTGSSEGSNDDEYRPVEQRDGYDVIEWIAGQDWCDGKVAMTGGSYGGFSSVQVAALAPPHLETIIPWNYTDDRYTDDCHYRGGALRCYYDIGSYGCSMVGMNSMPPYPEYSGDRWAELWEERLERNSPYLLTWLANQKDGEYWRPGSIRGRYHEIKASALLIGGWRDGYCNAPLRTSQHMTAPSKVLIGPWNHSGPDCDTPGPSLAREHLTLRWCDYWLKGIDNGIMDEPDINVYVQTFDAPDAYRTHTSGYWRTERTFPIPGGRTHRLGLGSDLTPDSPYMARDGYEEYESSAAPRKYPEPSPRVVPWEITQDVMRDRTGLRLHLVGETRASADMTVKLESRLEVWTSNRNPADTTAIGQHFRTITRTDGVIEVDTSANVRSTKDAIHVSIDLDVRVNGLPHRQRRWVESFKRELL